MTEKKIVEIKNLTKTYGTRGFQTKVLKGIDLMIFQHDFIAIMGPSGSGKTTLLNDQGNATILMVTHDAFSASYAKDVYILNDGMMKCQLTRGKSRKDFYDRIVDMQASMGSDFS